MGRLVDAENSETVFCRLFSLARLLGASLRPSQAQSWRVFCAEEKALLTFDARNLLLRLRRSGLLDDLAMDQLIEELFVKGARASMAAVEKMVMEMLTRGGDGHVCEAGAMLENGGLSAGH